MCNNLKTIRQIKGLTQDQVGELIDRSKSFISDVEAGRSNLTTEQISSLADQLGVEARWLSTGEGDMTENDNSRDRRTIGERIYQIRRNRRLNQTEFAELIGVSRNTVSLLERRKIGASQGVIRAVVEKTGVSEQWLRTGEEESKASEIMDWLEKCPADKEKIREWLSKERGSADGHSGYAKELNNDGKS